MITGPDTKYMMMWGGEWRPVTNLLIGNIETNNPLRATAAVLFVDPGCWVACAINPGEIIERTDRDPNIRRWGYID